MRILQLCHRVPWPPIDGGRIAMGQVTQGLRALGHDVTVVALNPSKSASDPSTAATALGVPLHSLPISLDPTPWGALAAGVQRQPYAMTRFRSRQLGPLVHRLQEERAFDLIWLEGIYQAPDACAVATAMQLPIVMRAHNVEAQVWAGHARLARNGFERSYYRLQAKQVERFEATWMPRFSAIAAISEADAADLTLLAAGRPVHVLAPYASATHTHRPAPSHAMGYLGALNWHPNRAGLDWFFAEVWPLILQAEPGATFLLAGREAPATWRRSLTRIPGVTHWPDVPQADGFYDRVALTVQPVLAAAGVRLKLLEAMASGRPVLTTPQGLRGVGAEAVVPASIESEALAAQALMLLRQPSLYAAAVRGQQAYVGAYHTPTRFQAQLAECLASAV